MILKKKTEYNDFLTVSIADSFISGFQLGAKFTQDTFVT